MLDWPTLTLNEWAALSLDQWAALLVEPSDTTPHSWKAKASTVHVPGAAAATTHAGAHGTTAPALRTLTETQFMFLTEAMFRGMTEDGAERGYSPTAALVHVAGVAAAEVCA